MVKVIECEDSFQLSFLNLLQLLEAGLSLVSHDIPTDTAQVVLRVIRAA